MKDNVTIINITTMSNTINLFKDMLVEINTLEDIAEDSGVFTQQASSAAYNVFADTMRATLPHKYIVLIIEEMVNGNVIKFKAAVLDTDEERESYIESNPDNSCAISFADFAKLSQGDFDDPCVARVKKRSRYTFRKSIE